MPLALLAVDAVTETRESPTVPDIHAPAREVKPRRDRRRRVAGLVTRVLRTSYQDALFERPDLIEDDYYRLRNQPRD